MLCLLPGAPSQPVNLACLTGTLLRVPLLGTTTKSLVWTAPSDAAMFASQSLELRSDRINREDLGGTLWNKPSSYEGDYLLVPPSGAEATDDPDGREGVPCRSV